jgi:hypothetical protein
MYRGSLPLQGSFLGYLIIHLIFKIMYTKKHFEMIAKALYNAGSNETLTSKHDVIIWLIGYFGEEFKQSNPKFDKQKFSRAAGSLVK